jgi:hypothetical protein
VLFSSTVRLKTLILTGGRGAQDISHILKFYWFEPVSINIQILINDLFTVLHHRVARLASDVKHRNKGILFKSDVQDSLNLLDKKPSSACYK